MTTTVVIIDDHEIWRAGIRSDLGEAFEVIGEAADARAGIELVREVNPDIALCDLHMPEGGGLAVATAVSELTTLIMVTVSEAERDVLDAVAAGAAGYLLKSLSLDELRDSLDKAARGEPVFSPSLAALVLGEFRRLSKKSPHGESLTTREREVLGQVARGLTYAQVGEKLHISSRTVENHVRNVLQKLRLTRRDELIRWAADHNIT